MIGNVTPNLPANLLGYLRPGLPALLLTAGADGYATSAYTWVVALDDIPAPARARALALAVAEILRASWAELALPEAHVDPAVVPPAVRRAVLLRLEGGDAAILKHYGLDLEGLH